MYPGITAATHPQRPAVIHAETGKVTTFQELHEASIRLSNVLRAAGLQPGDMILSINGRPVGVASSDTALMAQVMASSRVRVEVKRGPRRFFLTVPVPKYGRQ